MKIGHIPLSGEVLDSNQNLQQETTYDNNNNGNIAYKSDAGEYFYDASKPFAITTLQNPEPALSTMQQDISYTPYHQPHEIAENGFKLQYHYGPDEQRRVSELFDEQDNLIKKIYYNGNYELIETNGNTYEVNDLFAPEGLFGIAVKENENPVQVYYVETDHLGSILGLYNEAGQPVYTQSFDAWGRERNPESWDYTTNTGTKPEWLIRGYTGHEHLPEFTLINMNGRMYDPILGRMLSPDNFVQAPTSSQSFNRYSYVFNNPLKYTDPSGEIALMPVIVAAVVFGYGGGAMASGNHNPFTSQYWNDGWQGFAKGAVLGATVASGMVAFAGTAGTGAAAGAAGAKSTLGSSLLSGGVNTIYNYEEGQSFLTTLGYFAAGAAGGDIGMSAGVLAGMATSGAANVLVHGFDSGWEASGREYAQKFVSGALSAYTGISTFGKVDYLKVANGTEDGGYFLGSKANAKAWRAGWLNQASDFAHSSKESFNKRSLPERAMMFGVAFAASHMGGMEEDAISELKHKSMFAYGVSRGIRQALAGYFEYHMQQTIHSIYSNNPSYLPWQYQYRGTKLSAAGYKALFYGLKLR